MESATGRPIEDGTREVARLNKYMTSGKAVFTMKDTNKIKINQKVIDGWGKSDRGEITELKQNILSTGKVAPIISLDGMLMEGYHRLVALKELGVKRIPIINVTSAQGDSIEDAFYGGYGTEGESINSLYAQNISTRVPIDIPKTKKPRTLK